MEQIDEQKLHGGYLKKFKHHSVCNNCEMTFFIYQPSTHSTKFLYYLPGMRSSSEKAAVKTDFARYAAKHNLMVVISDTSPRGLDFEKINEN